MTENATPTEDANTSMQDTGAPAIGQGEEQPDGGPGSHTEDGTGGSVDDPAAAAGSPRRRTTTTDHDDD